MNSIQTIQVCLLPELVLLRGQANDKMSMAAVQLLSVPATQPDVTPSQYSIPNEGSINTSLDLSDPQHLQHQIVNLDDVSLSEWLNESITSPSPPIALSTKLPHFLPAGVSTSTKLIPLGSMIQELKLINEQFCEEELVSISIQLLDAIAASDLYGRAIGKELAGGFITLGTVMVDEDQNNYYLTSCRYGVDKSTHTSIHARNGALESLYIPPWGIPSQAELRQGMTTRGSFGRVSSSISFWSLGVLLCECILLKPLPAQRIPQQIGAYRRTSPTAIANMIVKLAKSNGCSEDLAEFIHSLMLTTPDNNTKVGSFLHAPIIQKYIAQWKRDGTHANIVERYERLYTNDMPYECNSANSGPNSPEDCNQLLVNRFTEKKV